MLTLNRTKTNRCSLCYALLSPNVNPTNASITTNRRHGYRCSVASIERLISSSRKLENLWEKTDNGMFNHRSICYRCCDTIRQIEQIQNHIEQLSNEEQILISKIEQKLLKRAQILQGQRANHSLPFSLKHQQIPIDEDDDTEEGEEKPRTVIKTNGHGNHSSSSVVSTTTLVGAKRRKSKIAHKINVENQSSLLNHLRRSNSPISQPIVKHSPNFLFDSSPASKHHRSSLFSTGLNGHNNDLANLSFSSAYKSLAIPTSSTAATPPFIDPTTGALIAIVSNPHHAALLAQQHQQMFKSSSLTPSSTNTIEEHDSSPSKQPAPLAKKFPCLLCGRDFSNKSNLNRHHSIVHIAIRNFECARCPKKFKLRQGLKTHMQRCHGVNTDEPTFVLQKHHAHHHLLNQNK